jgi:hypothetical protein
MHENTAKLLEHPEVSASKASRCAAVIERPARPKALPHIHGGSAVPVMT